MGLSIAIDGDDIAAYGAHGAIVLQQIRWWIKIKGDDGWFTATSAELADITYLSPDQVRRTVKQLVDAGAIEKRKRHRNQGSHVLSYRPISSGESAGCPPNPSGEIAKSGCGEIAKSGCGEIATSSIPLDVEEKQLHLLPQSAPPTTAKAKTKRGSRIPDGWTPPADVVADMSEHHGHVDQSMELAKFRDYWAAKSGRDATKLDWSATYRNWIRNAAERTGRPTSAASSARGSLIDTHEAAFAAAFPDLAEPSTAGNVPGSVVDLSDSCVLSSPHLPSLGA